MRRLFALLLALLTLSACTAPAPEPTPPPTARLSTPWLDDYELFWAVLEENYPQVAALERIRGVSLSSLREKYRSSAEKAQSAQDLYRVLEGCSMEFGYTGHLGVLNADTYRLRMDGLRSSSDAKGAYNYETLDNPASRAFYGYVEGEAAPAGSGVQMGEAVVSASQNLVSRMSPEEKTGYVEILSMNSPNAAQDEQDMRAFFMRLESEGYEHCMIDIRRNGGGSSTYPMMVAVAPNVTEPVWSTHYALVRGGKEMLSYLDVVKEFWPLRPIEDLPAGDLPALEPGDLAAATHYFTVDVGRDLEQFELPEKPLFSGQFWLLAGPGSYSASEYFAVFCKDTGFATLVGEPTGGDGIGLDPYLHALTNSGICFQFSPENGLNLDGSCNEEQGTVPDILTEKGQDALQICQETIARLGSNGL